MFAGRHVQRKVSDLGPEEQEALTSLLSAARRARSLLPPYREAGLRCLRDCLLSL
jgi:hypothetical protein